MNLEALRSEAILEVRARASRIDRCAYVELCALDNRGRPMRQSWIHRSWHGHIEWCWAHSIHPVVISPWGQGKSVQLAVETPVWALGRWKWLRVSVVSNIDSNARLRAAAAERAINRRPTTRLAFPDLRVPGQHSQFSFSVAGSGGSKVDPSFRAWGIFGSGIGSRIDLLILDDIVDQNNALKNPALRQAVCEQVDTVWFSRLTPPCMSCGGSGVLGGSAAWDAGSRAPCPRCEGSGGGRSVSIGTMWHEADHWHRCLKTPGYCTLLQRVNKSKTGYTSEVYGVPSSLRYPTLEELILLGSPSSSSTELLGRLVADQEARRIEEAGLGVA